MSGEGWECSGIQEFINGEGGERPVQVATERTFSGNMVIAVMCEGRTKMESKVGWFGEEK